MRLSQLRDFIDIVEAGSLRAAARRRGISQPVLSKSLRALEGEVEARLLQRTAQGIVLTASGRALLARARAVHAQLLKAREEISWITGARGATVSLGASASGLVLLPEALERFRVDYPAGHVRIVEGAPGALLPLLRDETLDFFLGPKPAGPAEPQVRTHPLFRLPLAVAGRLGHPLRGAGSLTELHGAPWLLLSAGEWSDSMLAQSLRLVGLGQPARLTRCESYSTAILLLSQTDTLGLLPRQHLADRSLRGLVEEIPVRERLPELAFAVYVRADDALTRGAQALMRLVIAAARSMMTEARRAGMR